MEPLTRCEWAEIGHAPTLSYHDHEWGVPVHDDDRLFEFLCLEGAQAGLSWRTVLDKRERFRQRFHGFVVARVAAMGDDELERCLTDPGIIRNRRKVFSFRDNARRVQEVVAELGSLDALLWSFVDGVPRVNRWHAAAEVPASTPRSHEMSRQLRRRGFRFVGPTICYALMQATGMVNDHVVGCFRHAECVHAAGAAQA